MRVFRQSQKALLFAIVVVTVSVAHAIPHAQSQTAELTENGRLLLTVGRAGEAERVFREDLTRTPENPWSLHGLAESLRVQQKETEAVRLRSDSDKPGWSPT